MFNQIHKLLCEYRQWNYPPAFRISDATGSTLSEPSEDILHQLRQLLEEFQDPELLEKAKVFTAADDVPFITDFITRLWRIQKALGKATVEDSEAKRAVDQLERLFSRFETMGISIDDKEGQFYDSGYAMKVISSEPTEGINREMIKETYKPGIYRGNNPLQVPEVIIGLPIKVETPPVMVEMEANKPDSPVTVPKEPEVTQKKGNDENSDAQAYAPLEASHEKADPKQPTNSKDNSTNHENTKKP